MINEEQVGRAMDLIAKKSLDESVLKYDMQNSSTVDYNEDLRKWLSGMTDYGYSTLIERLGRMSDREPLST